MKTGIRDQPPQRATIARQGPRQGSGISPSGSDAAEETLRLLAHLPAPEGLEDRVQAGLRGAAKAASQPARILAWPVIFHSASGWMQSSVLRSAAAALIAFVVVGGGWVVSSRVQVAQPATAITIPPRTAAPSGFSSAGAMRTPQTLNGPIIEPPAVVHPLEVAPPVPLAPAKHLRVKSKSANKPIAPPAK